MRHHASCSSHSIASNYAEVEILTVAAFNVISLLAAAAFCESVRESADV